MHIIPLVSNAAWPIITTPTTEEILTLISHADCPIGTGKILPKSKINISSPYIPMNEMWTWEYSGNSSCQKLPANLHELQYDSYQQIGPMQISIGYGTSIEKMLFKFSLTIISVMNWDCGPLTGSNPPVKIGCARDS